MGANSSGFPPVTWANVLIVNLSPDATGNIIGGALMVGTVYWFVYLRRNRFSNGKE